jgi:hypothetical protein
MRRGLTRGGPRRGVVLATLLAAICGLVPAGPTMAAEAADAGWRTAYIHPEVAEHDTGFEKLAVVDRDDVWATGSLSKSGTGVGTLTHWDGTGWKDVPTPVELGWSGPIGATSASNVWAFGMAKYPATGNHAMRWNGYSWKVTSTGSFRVEDAAVLGKNDVWGVGFDDQARGNRAMHWNGRTWRKVSMPDHPMAITARTPTDLWAVGVREYEDQEKLGLVSVMRWRGEKWRRVSIPKVTLPPGYSSGLAELWDVTALSATNVWAIGKIVWNPDEGDGPLRTLVLRWNGKKWTVRIGDGQQDDFYNNVAPDGAGGVWMTTTDGAYVHHAKNGKVTRYDAPFPPERLFPPRMSDLAHVPGTTSMLAAGNIQPVPATDDETWDAVIQGYGLPD